MMGASGLDPHDEEDDERSQNSRVPKERLAVLDRLMDEGGIEAVREALRGERK
jgi:hypothetical protein